MGDLKPNRHSPSLYGELGFYFVAAIVPMGVSVVGMAWALRLVPPAEFGVFNLLSGTASIVATGAFHWLCQWILRYANSFVARETRATYWTVLWRGATAALGLIIAAALVIVGFRTQWAPAVGATLLLCITLAAQAILITVLQGTGRARQYASTLASSMMLRWISTIVLCYIWKGSVSPWWTLLWGQCIGQLAAAVLAIAALRGDVFFGLAGRGHRPLELQALSYGAPFLVWAISMQLLNVADRYIIAVLRNAHDVGIYSAVYNIANAAVMVFTNPVLLAFTPKIFSHAGATTAGLDSKTEVRDLTEKGLQLLILFGIPLFSFSILLRNDVVTLVLGRAYRPAAMVFPLVTFGTLLWQIAQIYQKGFETAARTRAIGSSISLAVGANLLLNFLLVPRWGINGAAIATIGSYLLYLVLVVVRVRSYGRPAVPVRTGINVLFSTAVSCAIFIIANEWLHTSWMRLVCGAVCGVMYLALLTLFCEPLLISQVRRIQLALSPH